ncbi:MAG: cation:proton antiporter [Candidatus Methanomethylophilaceae archaeon]|nr:cation:proton antiporter [Candidatus Methanomethylophilaceae archaeon]
MELMMQLLFTMAVLFVLARCGSALVSRFGLPGLIGEIVIGIVVANLAFGDWSLMEALGLAVPAPGMDVTTGSDLYMIIYTFAELGVIFLLFTVGLETKVGDLLGSGKAALLTAVMGVILPFIAGFAVIMATEGHMNHALFMAAAMVATSVGITARIIKDMRLMDTREARIIIGAAVIDDVLGMIVLAIVKGMADSGEVSIPSILSITLQAILFVVAVLLACKFVVPRIYDYFDARKRRAEAEGRVVGSVNKLILAIVVCLAMAALAEYMGLAAIIGAFLAGMLFADYAWEWDLEHKVESITSFFISFFFLNVGFQVDISTLTDTSVIVLAVFIIALALVTKYIGCGVGAKMGDRSIDRSSFNIIGVGMVPRGEVGIIVASIGLASGAMSPELYAVVVLMSVSTTIIAPPILSKMFRKKYPEDYRILPDDQV